MKQIAVGNYDNFSMDQQKAIKIIGLNIKNATKPMF